MATKQQQEALVNDVYEKEVLIAEANQDDNDNDFESYLGIIDGVRDEKDYEWQSDIRIPEFMSHFLTQAGIDVRQYFTTRDFVEVKINDSSKQAKASADAAKELINRTLNKRDLYHYQKYVRARGVNNLIGKVYLKCWWDQEFEEQETGTTLEETELDVDVNGQPLEFEFQVPAVDLQEVPLIEDVAIVDKFNYDVWDQRNVFVSNEYVYSLQDKEWIIFGSEATMSDLKADAKRNGYFNLDQIGKPPEHTDVKERSYEKGDLRDSEAKTPSGSKAEKPYDLLERYGKYWMIEKDGEFDIGIDENGDVIDGAVYQEAIVTIVKSESTKTLIGFKKTGFIDATGKPYKPCIRGLNYIHPTQDSGIGDGQNVRELQTAMDDTFNVSQDRVMLATLPSLKGARKSIEDNSSIYIEPMHMMELNDINDVQEFKITDNIAGALNQLAYLEDKGRQVDAVNEVTTGGVPSISSTTATAVGASAEGTATRMNYKSLTFEYTALIEMYWMIQQMTYAFAQEKTGFELMGDKLFDFDPTLEFYYTPLSQSIEPEHSKIVKRREWNTILQTVIGIQHPDAVRIANVAISELLKLMGDEYEGVLLDENTPIQAQGGQQQGQGQALPPSNQSNVPQSTGEQQTREIANA